MGEERRERWGGGRKGHYGHSGPGSPVLSTGLGLSMGQVHQPTNGVRPTTGSLSTRVTWSSLGEGLSSPLGQVDWSLNDQRDQRISCFDRAQLIRRFVQVSTSSAPVGVRASGASVRVSASGASIGVGASGASVRVSASGASVG
eukprot:CAMPEP_0196666860 /NCGR_PEP_ID=MMETSP1086-20130531/64756_1 /TAXON_ID=77921 /ORGANISM="Cyanoptyche  gloeocystis , Strain SAG4.97" /LENGTH=143 /DNA_ID=CAMNT_0042004117 /DNA_START=661 /DNA_END=1088 /DNA_ORIENTATION=-